jgi:hypothetical protein
MIWKKIKDRHSRSLAAVHQMELEMVQRGEARPPLSVWRGKSSAILTIVFFLLIPVVTALLWYALRGGK